MPGLFDQATNLMILWHDGKLSIERTVTIDHTYLHVIFGMCFWVAAAAFGRKSLSSPIPWLWLLSIILWNEMVDLWIEQWPEPSQQYGEGAKDLFFTMLFPTLFMVGAQQIRRSRRRSTKEA